MSDVCLLITKPPHSDEGSERMCGIAHRAKEKGNDVTVFLLGDGVYCAKKGQKGRFGQNLQSALDAGITIKASKRDLEARAMPDGMVNEAVVVVEDLEKEFIIDTMENAKRVITW